jgi:hypothetical protein
MARPPVSANAAAPAANAKKSRREIEEYRNTLFILADLSTGYSNVKRVRLKGLPTNVTRSAIAFPRGDSFRAGEWMFLSFLGTARNDSQNLASFAATF